MLHSVNLIVPRRFYVNLRTAKPVDEGPLYRKVGGSGCGGASKQTESGAVSTGRVLPRSHTVYHLYQYTVPEDVYSDYAAEIASDLARPDIEGVYELNTPALFRALVQLGCLCSVDREAMRAKTFPATPAEDTVFPLDHLRFRSLAQHSYLADSQAAALRHVFLFHFQQPSATVGQGKRDSARQVSQSFVGELTACIPSRIRV